MLERKIRKHLIELNLFIYKLFFRLQIVNYSFILLQFHLFREFANYFTFFLRKNLLKKFIIPLLTIQIGLSLLLFGCLAKFQDNVIVLIPLTILLPWAETFKILISKHIHTNKQVENIQHKLNKKTAMPSKQQVDNSSSQWSSVDFKVQMITGKSSLNMVSIFRFDDGYYPQQQFKTDGVLQITDFDRDYIDRVVKKTILSEQMIFNCGHINITPYIKPNKVFTFLLCKLHLGKIGTVKDDVSLADSILLDSEKDSQSFQYNFMINNISRYSVKYEVNFTVGDEREFIQNKVICANCQNKHAKIYCKNQQLNLCDECCKEHHSRRMMQGHELQRINNINTLPNCKLHTQKFKYYCQRCHKYLCSVCLQKGNSHGNNDHPVSQISELYNQKNESNQLLPIKQKEKIENLMQSLQLKKGQIQQNYKQIKAFLDEQHQKSLNTLKELFTEKMFILNSDQIELKMTNQRLEWYKVFMHFQGKILKPIHYFQFQEKQNIILRRFEQELSKFKMSQFENIYAIKGDIAAQGQIIVAKKQFLDRSRNQASPSINTDRQKVDNRPSLANSNVLSKQKTIYQYDLNAQPPTRGQLALLLENSKLNFFCIDK